MKQSVRILLACLAITLGVPALRAQETDEATRIRNRDQMGSLLARVGPDSHMAFRQSDKQPYNHVAILTQGLTNADSFEIVISTTTVNTYTLRAYPHYKGGYINVDTARNNFALMRLLLRLSDRAFLFWGADDTGDVFAAYTFTLESGFPAESITTVLRSIKNCDQFIAEMKPMID
jgi:hypothetical protein